MNKTIPQFMGSIIQCACSLNFYINFFLCITNTSSLDYCIKCHIISLFQINTPIVMSIMSLFLFRVFIVPLYIPILLQPMFIFLVFQLLLQFESNYVCWTSVSQSLLIKTFVEHFLWVKFCTNYIEEDRHET